MAITKLTNEELESMSYTDIAAYVLEQKGKKMKIGDIFMEVIKLRGDSKEIFEEKIGDFFGLVSTDKRFIMLDKGFFDLSKNHKNKIEMSLNEEEDEEIVLEEEEETDEEEVIDYDEAIDVDDDQEEDDFKDLVVIDTDDENNIDL